MRRATPPDWHGIADYDRIASSKLAPRGACLADLRERVEGAYARYRACAPEMTDCHPLTLSSAEKEALLHCYDSSTDALDSMLSRIPRERWCPSCNLPNATEWDHYLPQMLFPEYSVCPQNLIRVCHDCNGKKLTAWRDENGERFILHAYYDWIERDEQIVHARFEVGGQNVRVIYDLRMEPREGRFRRMRRHVIKLGLMERYGSYAEEIVVPAMLAAVDAGDRAAQVRKLFRRMSDRIRANYGANHWHAIAYQAAADSDDFIQHALQRVPHD